MAVRAALFFLAALGLAVPAAADEAVKQLTRALRLTEVVSILRDEGLAYGRTLDSDMLDGDGGAYFAARVSDIYDPDRMHRIMSETMAEAMGRADIVEATVFFDSPLGQTIIALENSARRAFSDPAIEDLARNRAAASDLDQPRARMIAEYIEVNDLIERNVDGALSADYAFYRGLAAGNGTRQDDRMILSDLWEQRDQTRAETTEWLFGFLTMAYQPLSDAELRDNIEFSLSEAGTALNRALFDGFDRLYDTISFELGQAVAFELTASDL